MSSIAPSENVSTVIKCSLRLQAITFRVGTIKNNFGNLSAQNAVYFEKTVTLMVQSEASHNLL